MSEAAPRLVLASASPRRQHLLRENGIEFDVIPATVDEWEAHDADPVALVLHNARAKGDAVAAAHPDRYVLSADTTVALDGHVLNKPTDMDDARRMLGMLAGRTHSVFTGVLLQCRDKAYRAHACVESRVTFRPLDAGAIEGYFKIVDPLDKAGAYGIQEGRHLIIASFAGSFTNIMGLPMGTVRALLEQLSH